MVNGGHSVAHCSSRVGTSPYLLPAFSRSKIPLESKPGLVNRVFGRGEAMPTPELKTAFCKRFFLTDSGGGKRGALDCHEGIIIITLVKREKARVALTAHIPSPEERGETFNPTGAAAAEVGGGWGWCF